ncbi:sigma-70 family RNA polymerase sigma factor [Cytophagaceae bacterium DM2B3-1]|uniref:Sigma-70 family RNA polymerase sigma factor n=1 Tax=Xanthocytophaga flava TaxID=3048013 RepID=A0AAE3QKC7_9BACT|nr:sigma-70 family RNA polymerase sigma factor [Xanthocytophaga flavus]MDJ1466419.1 sigma-70 family RNA polymerase sigma factor [Xanthocytophaga flavus]MDJ1479075.1 sigma-70 family RNA polymerase sigma factor [Xanthocytophaga flavus]MDJ1497925.1 sigma-70 family RNA polymerase sigma factor [Xanthocytophaga flavus]
MNDSLSLLPATQDIKNQTLKLAFQHEKQRLLAFIRKRVPEKTDAEDILQDVFYQLAETFNVLEPIEQISAWLFRVARNKIIDRYRKKKPESLEQYLNHGEDEESWNLSKLLFDPQDGPENTYTRTRMWDTLAEALEELPDEQKEVFVWHELEGKSFKEISETTGVTVNTLLSRKRYAVLHLRKRLETLYDEIVGN